MAFAPSPVFARARDQAGSSGRSHQPCRRCKDRGSARERCRDYGAGQQCRHVAQRRPAREWGGRAGEAHRPQHHRRDALASGKAFVQRRAGVIINIVSVLALAPELLEGVYSGSKAYLLNLTLKLALDVNDMGVRVQAVLPGATRTEIWERSGKDVDALMPGMVMDVDDLVDAALVGLDKGEVVTIPPLADERQWTAYNEARLAMAPNLSRDEVADRYRQTVAA
ncbi:MAG TPA: SDR family NAD(P)-dependent oxidoreductase [Stellaceae bacterium]